MCDTSNALVRSLVIWDHTVNTWHPTEVILTPLPKHKMPVLICRPWKDERLSWPRWLVVPRWFTHRRSPSQVLTGPDVE